MEVDILGIQELNVCWRKVGEQHRIWDRFRNWKEICQLSAAYNTRDINSVKYQPGGTAIVTINKLAHRVIDHGGDSSNLGRWVWTRYQGSFNRKFVVFSVYRPIDCKGKKGYNSAYEQQLCYSMKYNGGRCPRELLLEDLSEELIK